MARAAPPPAGAGRFFAIGEWPEVDAFCGLAATSWFLPKCMAMIADQSKKF
jgi:hypothetical protein